MRFILIGVGVIVLISIIVFFIQLHNNGALGGNSGKVVISYVGDSVKSHVYVGSQNSKTFDVYMDYFFFNVTNNTNTTINFVPTNFVMQIGGASITPAAVTSGSMLKPGKNTHVEIEFIAYKQLTFPFAIQLRGVENATRTLFTITK
jgi:hypothetical protein